jgi:hypothetical protein
VIGIVWTLVSGKVIAAFKWATQSLTHILIVALVASLAWGAIERHGKHKAQRVLASTVTAWKAAEREATAAQIAANSAQQARWAQQARNVDDGYQKARVDADSRSERFIRSGGLRCPANPRGTGSGDPVQSPDAAASVDGAGAQAVLVAVVPDDVRICSENTTRLQAAQEWALGL